MLSGTINPGQLQIVREILPGSGGFSFDTAVFSGNLADYTIVIDDNGTPLNAADDIVTVTDNVVGRDGIDRLTAYRAAAVQRLRHWCWSRASTTSRWACRPSATTRPR